MKRSRQLNAQREAWPTDDFLRRSNTAANLLRGCAQEYLVAITTGRLDKWAAMAHAIVDLLANDPVESVEEVRHG